MSSLVTLAVMSALLGLSSCAMGILPLILTFSPCSMSRLTHVGSGLLLGAGLGIIIPEGVEALVHSQVHPGYVPTLKIALSLLTGFTFMLIVEQILSPHSHDNSQQSPSSDLVTSDLSSESESSCACAREDGLEQGVRSPHSKSNSQHHCYQSLSSTSVASSSNSASTCAFPRRENEPELDVESTHLRNSFRPAKSTETSAGRANKNRAYPLTLGLVLHALADGLALGSSVLSDSGSTKRSSIVFLALMVHKAPTALALTTSLLATSLSKANCKRHIAVFSAATPIGALAFYATLHYFGATQNSELTGLAMLFSGGSFLYVAAVLQPVSPHSGHQTAEGDIGHISRTLLIAMGMFVPVCISSVIGHGHGWS